MTNEEKFLGYLENLKGEYNQKLVECIQDGFKTLVEYQVVGTMSERGIDLMEDAECSVKQKNEQLVNYIEKLDSEIDELRSAMQKIDDIADEHDIEMGDTIEDDSRDSVEEAIVMSPDGVAIPTSSEGLEFDSQEATIGAKDMESGGSLVGREPQKLDDIDPRDIEPIEVGQHEAKVEGTEVFEECNRDTLEENESGEMPENVRRGESGGNVVETNENDSEGKMANKQLDQISDQSGKLAGSFADDEELKSWVQAKITKAQETIDALYDFFRDEKGLDEKPSEDAAGEDENPIFEK